MKLEHQQELNELNQRFMRLRSKRYGVGLTTEEARELRTVQNARHKIINELHPLPPCTVCRRSPTGSG